jgi:ribosomal-protein-alanine N-acetyltransferase
LTAVASGDPPPGPGGGSGEVPAVTFRHAALADVARVAAIEAQSFSNPWQPDAFRSLISQGRAYIPVAEDPRGGLVGYAVFWWVMDQGELANLAVLKGYQGLGIGSGLLGLVLDRAAEEEVKELFLEVRSSNRRAMELYRSRGFKQVGTREDYYRNPREDAYLLMKKIVPK